MRLDIVCFVRCTMSVVRGRYTHTIRCLIVPKAEYHTNVSETATGKSATPTREIRILRSRPARLYIYRTRRAFELVVMFR